MIVIVTTRNFTALAGLYAIGVVGAITVNLGSCCFNRVAADKDVSPAFFSASPSPFSFLSKSPSLIRNLMRFSLSCVCLELGLTVRAWTLKRRGLTTVMVPQQVAQMVTPDLATTMQSRLEEGQKIMVAARGITPVLSFALDEAQLRKATSVRSFRQGNCRLLRAAGQPRSVAPAGRMIRKRMPSCHSCSKLGSRTRRLRATGLRRERRRRHDHSRSFRHHGSRLSYAWHFTPHCPH